MPHLLTLPSEVRKLICEYTFLDPEIRPCKPVSADSCHNELMSPKANLALVCKQINAEVRSVEVPKATLITYHIQCFVDVGLRYWDALPVFCKGLKSMSDHDCFIMSDRDYSISSCDPVWQCYELPLQGVLHTQPKVDERIKDTHIWMTTAKEGWNHRIREPNDGRIIANLDYFWKAVRDDGGELKTKRIWLCVEWNWMIHPNSVASR